MTDTAGDTTPARWKGYARDVYIEDTVALDPATSPPAHVTATVYLDGDPLPLAAGSTWSVSGGHRAGTVVEVEVPVMDVAVQWLPEPGPAVRLAGHYLLVPEGAVPDLDGLDKYDTVTVQFFAATVTIGGPRP